MHTDRAYESDMAENNSPAIIRWSPTRRGRIRLHGVQTPGANRLGGHIANIYRFRVKPCENGLINRRHGF